MSLLPPASFRIPATGEAARPMRLDAALGLMLPELGLRARRRLWQFCRITVNDIPRTPGHTVFPGDCVCIDAVPGAAPPLPDAAPAVPGVAPTLPNAAPAVLYEDAQLIAFFKPPGLHTAHIAGSPLPSLEARLPRTKPPLLLTRLDAQTSGIVLAARTNKSGLLFRQAEQAGGVTKNYIALVRGELGAPLVLTRRLNMRNRAVTAVLEEEEPDSARHTQAAPVRLLLPKEMETLAATLPIGFDLPPALTLAEITIHRGARHQIRAHMAHAGFPLLGETLYAQPLCDGPHPLYLHHARVSVSLEAGHEFTAVAKAPWPFLS